jgi:hypothetical protein
MILLSLSLVQAATAMPDIELSARVRARSITIEKQGDASLTVTTSPDGGNLVDVRAPKANGRKTLRNVEVNVRAAARIGDRAAASPNNPSQTETVPPG